MGSFGEAQFAPQTYGQYDKGMSPVPSERGRIRSGQFPGAGWGGARIRGRITKGAEYKFLSLRGLLREYYEQSRNVFLEDGRVRFALKLEMEQPYVAGGYRAYFASGLTHHALPDSGPALFCNNWWYTRYSVRGNRKFWDRYDSSSITTSYWGTAASREYVLPLRETCISSMQQKQKSCSQCFFNPGILNGRHDPAGGLPQHSCTYYPPNIPQAAKNPALREQYRCLCDRRSSGDFKYVAVYDNRQFSALFDGGQSLDLFVRGVQGTGNGAIVPDFPSAWNALNQTCVLSPCDFYHDSYLVMRYLNSPQGMNLQYHVRAELVGLRDDPCGVGISGGQNQCVDYQTLYNEERTSGSTGLGQNMLIRVMANAYTCRCGAGYFLKSTANGETTCQQIVATTTSTTTTHAPEAVCKWQCINQKALDLGLGNFAWWRRAAAFADQFAGGAQWGQVGSFCFLGQYLCGRGVPPRCSWTGRRSDGTVRTVRTGANSVWRGLHR